MLLMHDYSVGSRSEHSVVNIDELLNPTNRSEKRRQHKKCEISQRDTEVKREYAKFTQDLLKLFKEKEVTVDDAIYTFVDIGDLTSEMQEATNIQGFLTALKKTQSWYNFETIASLADVLGGNSGKKLVDSYEAKLKVHLTKRSRSQRVKTEKIVIKVDKIKEHFTEEKVIAFRNTIVRLFKLEHEKIVLKSLKKGCVELTYLFPATLAPEVKKNVMACTGDLKKLHVISVHIGRYNYQYEHHCIPNSLLKLPIF